ncbi:MAG: hypothetical protein ACTSU4_00785 [Promethearchaeota archaeon]
MNKLETLDLKKLNVDELTELFAEFINDQNLLLIQGIEYLVEEDFDNFEKSLKSVIETAKEEEIKKTFESKIFKTKLMFSKADRLKVFRKINDTKNIGEYLAHKLLIYRVIFPDENFKLQVQNILKSLKMLSMNITEAIKFISTDLSKSRDLCENIKEERRRMRKAEWKLLTTLWNYDMDYLSRTFLYLKEFIEGIMMLADHLKNFSEYIQFLATKYLIFE